MPAAAVAGGSLTRADRTRSAPPRGSRPGRSSRRPLRVRTVRRSFGPRPFLWAQLAHVAVIAELVVFTRLLTLGLTGERLVEPGGVTAVVAFVDLRRGDLAEKRAVVLAGPLDAKRLAGPVPEAEPEEPGDVGYQLPGPIHEVLDSIGLVVIGGGAPRILGFDPHFAAASSSFH